LVSFFFEICSNPSLNELTRQGVDGLNRFELQFCPARASPEIMLQGWGSDDRH
jgi:hypothetical protein